MNALTNVAYFLVDTLFTLYIIVVILRILLGLVKADFYNPLSQFIVAATNPVIVPLRRLLPPMGKIDSAAVLVVVLLGLIKISLLAMISGQNASFAAIFLLTIVGLIKMVVYIFMFSLIILAVISWINPTGQGSNPMYSLLKSITDPLVRPIAAVLPRMGMFDLSFLAAILLLQVILIVLNSI